MGRLDIHNTKFSIGGNSTLESNGGNSTLFIAAKTFSVTPAGLEELRAPRCHLPDAMTTFQLRFRGDLFVSGSLDLVCCWVCGMLHLLGVSGINGTKSALLQGSSAFS